MSDRVVVIQPEPERVVVIGNVVAGAAAAHPDLAAHDLLGLATQIELDTHAATAGHTHPNLAAHDALGLATQIELDAVATAKADTAHAHPHTHPIERTTVTTAAYTAAIGDANKVIRMTLSGASTLTIPANATVAFPLDTIINAYAAGGALTIAAAAGVTIDNNASGVAQGVEVSLRKDGTDKWVRAG